MGSRHLERTDEKVGCQPSGPDVAEGRHSMGQDPERWLEYAVVPSDQALDVVSPTVSWSAKIAPWTGHMLM